MRRFLVALLSCGLMAVLADGRSETLNSSKPASEPTSSLACGHFCGQKAQPPIACGDYLKELGRSRREVEYLGCEATMLDGPPIPGFKATYRVRGSDLDKIDKWLATWTEWKRLRFSCCQWDAPTGFYRDKSGSDYYIDMGADAYVNGHMIDRRKDFSKLPYATLRISHYLYLP